MANPLWVYNVTLQGDSVKNKTTLKFILEYEGAATPMTHGEALSAAAQIGGALAAVTDAEIGKEWLNFLVSSSAVMGTGDTTDEAYVLTYLNEASELPKLHGVRIPAPISGLFMADNETVNVENAALIQFVQQIAQHALVSDNESINTAIDNGIARGHKRSRAKSFK